METIHEGQRLKQSLQPVVQQEQQTSVESWTVRWCEREPESGEEQGDDVRYVRESDGEARCDMLECSCDPYVWDEDGENVVDYDGSCYCEAGAASRDYVARERRAFEISLMGYALDEDCNHVDIDGKTMADEDADGEIEEQDDDGRESSVNINQ